MAFNDFTKQQIILENGGKVPRVKKGSKWLFPFGEERQYQRELIKLSDIYEQKVKEIIYPQLDNLVRQVSFTMDSVEHKDDWTDFLTGLLFTTNSEYHKEISENVIRYQAISQANKISVFNKNQFNKVINSQLSINPIIAEPYLQSQVNAFVKENVSLVTKLNMERSQRLEETLLRNLSEGASKKELIKTLQSDIFDFSKNRSKLIARDQTNKFNGRLTELRQTDLGIEEYIWVTSRDERVRSTHKARDGKIFKWSDKGIKPGSEVRCRCTAQPVINESMFD